MLPKTLNNAIYALVRYVRLFSVLLLSRLLSAEVKTKHVHFSKDVFSQFQKNPSQLVLFNMSPSLKHLSSKDSSNIVKLSDTFKKAH